MRWIGVAGIALSTAIVYCVSFTFMLTMLYRHLPEAAIAKR
jgi:Na+-driven multidrug efflux pump